MFGNLLQQKQHVAVSIAIDYLLEYFKTGPARYGLTASRVIRRKNWHTYLVHNASQSKRFLSVAKHHRDSLSLVQEGNMTWMKLWKCVGKTLRLSRKSWQQRFWSKHQCHGGNCQDWWCGRNQYAGSRVELNVDGDDSRMKWWWYSYKESDEPRSGCGGEGDSVTVTSDIASYEFSEPH